MSEAACVPSVSKTLRHELAHLIVAALWAMVVGYLSHEWLTGIVAFIIGMFLDADHGIDYLGYLIRFRRRLNLQEFLSGSYFSEWKKFITPLHAWELVFILVIVGIWQRNWYLTGAGGAMAIHYLVDFFTNPVNIWAYWLTYRVKYKFYKPAISRTFQAKDLPAQ